MKIPGLKLDGSLDELPWRSTRDKGIHWIDLRRHGREAAASPGPPASPASPGSTLAPETDGPIDPARDLSMTVLIRMDPGCGYPRHRHLGAEDVLVLAGGYGDDDGRVFRAGEFVRYPSGSEHSPLALGVAGDPIGPSNPACILFAVAHGGTEVTQAPDPSAAIESRQPLQEPRP